MQTLSPDVNKPFSLKEKVVRLRWVCWTRRGGDEFNV